MSSKKKIIFWGCVLILINFFSIIYILFPKIDIHLNGEKNIVMLVNDTYEELGAKAHKKNIFFKKTLDIKIKGNVDTNNVGKYNLYYSAKSGGIYKSIKRTVEVVDNEFPKLDINSIKMCEKNKLVEIEATAIDNYDGDISKNINYEIKNNNIVVSIKDSSGNLTEVKEKIKYIDDEMPNLLLNGTDKIFLEIGSEYNELGATANDSCDGDISDNIVIKNNLNPNKTGKYEIVYEISDNNGNKTTKIRTVEVIDKEEPDYKVINGATIYLTFDDGPFKYTDGILNVLDKYNIKATFFVTNQFPNYRNMIKKEFEKGHAVGIHTSSHQWSIYESIDSYLNDFNEIDNIIYEQTGQHSKIFRFPGGSSNQVSIKYNKGIMTKLSEYMTKEGYIYFDWNVDSGDTSRKNSSTKAIIKNVKKSLKGDGNYIILMHDIKKNTLEALPEIIEYALSLGYEFKALDENSPQVHFKIAN